MDERPGQGPELAQPLRTSTPEDTGAGQAVGWLRGVGLFLLGSLIFTLAYAQAPLYYSNQHQYFLHGLAQAGRGILDEDWLANTRDPTPVFTFLVAFTARHLHEGLFYGYYALLMGGYLAGMVGLFRLLAGRRATWGWPLAFIALLLLFHAALPRLLSIRLFGIDYPWYFQAGLAGQYLLGPVLQPSTFGVLLLLSLVSFGQDRPVPAGVWAGLAGLCHATYLLPAAVLTLGYLLVLARERRFRQAVLAGGCALLLVLPIVAYNARTFRPTSPEVFARAQEILVQIRIPHHAIPRLWLDEVAIAQIAWAALGIGLTRGTRLFPVLVLALLAAGTLTLVQVATRSGTLALLFPWRMSALLVPVATAVILARLLRVLASRTGGNARTERAVGWGSGLVIGGLSLAGAGIMAWGLGFQTSDAELPLLEHIREHQRPGDVYLIPVRVPDLQKSTRGSVKGDFKPLLAVQSDRKLLPLDLQSFRLASGAPLFVDFKSIPYADRDVIDWYERVRTNQEVYADLDAGRLDRVVAHMRRLGLSHLVTRPTDTVDHPALIPVFTDPQYHLYRLSEVPRP